MASKTQAIKDSERYVKRFNETIAHILLHSWAAYGSTRTPCSAPVTGNSKKEWFMGMPKLPQRLVEWLSSEVSPKASKMLTLAAGVRIGTDERLLEIWRVILSPKKNKTPGDTWHHFKAYVGLCDILKATTCMVKSMPVFRLTRANPDMEATYSVEDSNAVFDDLLSDYDAHRVGSVQMANCDLTVVVAFTKETKINLFSPKCHVSSRAAPVAMDGYMGDRRAAVATSAAVTPSSSTASKPRSKSTSTTRESFEFPPLRMPAPYKSGGEDVTDNAASRLPELNADDRTSSLFSALLPSSESPICVPKAEVTQSPLEQQNQSLMLSDIPANEQDLVANGPFGILSEPGHVMFPSLNQLGRPDGHSSKSVDWHRYEEDIALIRTVFPGKMLVDHHSEHQALAADSEALSHYLSNMFCEPRV
eukprot:scpid66224/ scgid31399/ 